jgi:uncharacterized protein YuzE
MDAKLSFKYDREADILYIDTVAPYAEQESEELGDDVVANPQTGEIENLEVLFFSTRLLRRGGPACSVVKILAGGYGPDAGGAGVAHAGAD